MPMRAPARSAPWPEDDETRLAGGLLEYRYGDSNIVQDSTFPLAWVAGDAVAVLHTGSIFGKWYDRQSTL
jgi:hypothetical protein